MRITIPEFHTTSVSRDIKDTKPTFVINSTNSNKKCLKINAIGESNHSGSTPMNERKDAVLGLADLILELDSFKRNNPSLNLNFLKLVTPSWGANQIQDNASLILEADNDIINMKTVIEELSELVKGTTGVSFEVEEISEEEKALIESPDNNTELFIDVRQQIGTTGKKTRKDLYELLKKVQHDVGFGKDFIDFKITSNGDPVKMSPSLIDEIKKICSNRGFSYEVMHSWAGHDVACVMGPNKTVGKRVLFFIPSTGGSHNPNELTTQNEIEIGADVYSDFVKQLAGEKVRKIDEERQF